VSSGVIDRVTNQMNARVSLATLGRTNLALFTLQQQIATGRSILRSSDDVVKAATIGVLDDRLLRSGQITRNLQHADSALSVADTTLEEAVNIAQQAKSIASGQVGATVTAAEREGQSRVVDSMLLGLFNIANQEGVAGFILGASQSATRAPVEPLRGGYRYRGRGDGLLTDLGSATAVPLTLGERNPIAGVSARSGGQVDLDPVLTNDTRLIDLRGARGLGVATGVIRMSVDSAAAVDVDLSGIGTAGEARTRIERAIRAHEQQTGTTVLGPGGVTFSGGRFSFDVQGAATTIAFTDPGSGVTARDLGLARLPASPVSQAQNQGLDTGPRLTMRTPLSAMAGLAGPLGRIVISNAGQAVEIDLSNATTLQDVRNLIEATDLGVRVEISADGSAIEIRNELAGRSNQSLSIGEAAGGNTATLLGIRTMSPATRLASFNFGKGVQIVDGAADPLTGLVDPERNVDFEIRLGDAAGTVVPIDLRPQDVVSVQTLLDRVNSQIQPRLAAAGLPADALVAGLTPHGNGLTFVQGGSFTGPIQVSVRNNSRAAHDLGLTTGSYDTATSTLTGEDRAKVRVECLFTHLLDLRHALTTNDVSGIQFASTDIEAAITRLAETRGVVGGYGQLIESASQREAERAVMDETVRSQLRDIDFTEAASRFTLLQTQLEAGLRTTAMASQRSLLDFLG
jgi:flagellin-like hook-associated protein FlgL